MIRVVIAEDDRSVAKTLSQIMLSIGFSPVVCSDGRRALQVIEDNPDTRLLITDVSMPHMDGRELVLRLQENDRFHKLPTIIISGLVGFSEIADLVDQGATYFLSKPVDPEELKKRAKSLVEQFRAVGE